MFNVYDNLEKMNFSKFKKDLHDQNVNAVYEDKPANVRRFDMVDVQMLQGEEGSRYDSITDDSSNREICRADVAMDDLPDGAFITPKHTPIAVSQPNMETVTVTRTAWYVGSVPANVLDWEVGQFLKEHLKSFTALKNRRKVMLVISLASVKVCSVEDKVVLMEYPLRQISYATCDSAHCHFSFLSRENTETHLCHAFVTDMPQQADDLNRIVGNAFKMAYDQQQGKPATFHQLIEAQVAEQRARFRKIEKEAKVDLQRKLSEIALPTPFSQHAVQRMSLRRQIVDDVPQRRKKLANSEDYRREEVNSDDKSSPWAAGHPAVETGHHSPSSTVHRLSLPQQCRQSDKYSLSGDRHSDHVVANVSQNGARSPNDPSDAASKLRQQPLHNLISASSCEECNQTSGPFNTHFHAVIASGVCLGALETKKDSKYKGSPVIALKNEIDRTFLAKEVSSILHSSGASEVGFRMQRIEQASPRNGFAFDELRPRMQETGASPASRPLPTPSSSTRFRTTASEVSFAPVICEDSFNNLGSSVRQRPISSYHCRARQIWSESSSVPPSSSPQIASGDNREHLTDINGTDVRFRESRGQNQIRPFSEIFSTSVHGAKTVTQHRQHCNDDDCFPSTPVSSTMFYSVSGTKMTAGLSTASSSLTDMASGSFVEFRPIFSPSSQQGCHGKVARCGRYETIPGDSPVMSSAVGCAKHRHAGSREASERLLSPSSKQVLRYQNDSPFHMQNTGVVMESCQQRRDCFVRLDQSPIEESVLREAAWFQAGIPREITLEILQEEEAGCFIVRESTTHPGCFALSMKVPKYENSSGISHYLILNTHQGVKLKGLDKVWPTLTALVTHHTVMREMLPCTLRLPHNTRNAASHQQTHRQESGDQTPDVGICEVTDTTGQLRI